MVYFFDKTIYQSFSQRRMLDDEICFFFDMANAHRKGQCYLCGDINSIKLLINNLNYPTSNIYSTILAHYAESRSIIEKVKTVFVLTTDMDVCFNTLPAILRTEGKTQIIHLENAMNWKNFECSLLAENLSDCEFLTLVSRKRHHHILNGIDIKFHYENGGGTTTADVLEKCLIQDKVPVLCVTDSDQKYGVTEQYPQPPPKGETFKKVYDLKKKIDASNNPPNFFFPLEVHELENLIPLYILVELKSKYPDISDGVNTLLNLRKIQNGTPILFYDFKNGFPFIDKEPKRVYWQKIANLMGFSEFTIPSSKEKYANTNMQHNPFPALHCKSLLRNVNSWLESHFEQNLILDEYLKAHWDNIADIIFTWGCVNRPMYS